MARDDSKIPEEDISSAIQVLERKDLDLLPIDVSNYGPGSAPAWGGGQFDFLRIKAISRSLPEKKADVERYMMEDVLSGLHGLKVPFIYLIIGSRLAINIYLGILNKPVPKPSPSFFLDVLVSSLESTFPDIEVAPLSFDEVDKNIIQFFQNCRFFGIMTGIPTAKIGVEEQGVEQIERLIRGVYRQEFGYMVIADPVQDSDVIYAFDDIANIIRDKSSLIKEARQYTQTSRVTLSGETLNKSVEYYVELLEILLEKLKLAKAQGMWRTMCYFFSPSPVTTPKMSNLLKTVFSGDKSKPEALRTLVIERGNPAAILSKFKQIELELNFHPAFSGDHPLRKIIKHKFITALPSRDLATLTHLPKEEMPGYDVKDTARFGTCLPARKSGTQILIGEVMDRGISTGNFYSIRPDDLVKHALVVGVTGSGKTNTCFYLLNQIWNGPFNTPFLVIEPAKTDYRSFLSVLGFQDLQVFTLGDETTSPFRLNPFEIMEGVRLQSHIDNLRAVFNASFVMYAPMPYVLERCIHEIYRDKGWDLTTNANKLQLNEENKSDIYPTLNDLYEKIDTVVESLGYEEKITMDVKAALKTRVGSLCIGGKGAMLNTRLSIPMDLLLSKPTILELQSIGDDEEKAFIIALLMARLYEYREAEYRTKKDTNIKHLTLIEEAHRLLTKTTTDFSNLEMVNTKAKAVESLCNILSEIRAFGEGIIIAEQIPNKLAADAIKNTSLKIMHRIVAMDDRDVMGSTMNLTEDQNRYVAIMEAGKGVTFSEGFHEPFLVQVPLFSGIAKTRNGSVFTAPGDEEVKRSMSKKMIPLNQIYAKYSGCKGCEYKCLYSDSVNHLLESPEIQKIFSKYLYGLVENKNYLVLRYPLLRESVEKFMGISSLNGEHLNRLVFCFLITAGNRFFKRKGVLYKHPSLSQQISFLNECFDDLINKWFSVKIRSEMTVETEKEALKFQRLFIKTFSCEDGPFPGCNEFCKYKCLFRYEVEPLVNDKTLDGGLLSSIQSGEAARLKVRNFCLNLARQITWGEDLIFLESIALCFFIQKSVQWSVQEILINIKKWFLDVKGGVSL